MKPLKILMVFSIFISLELSHGVVRRTPAIYFFQKKTILGKYDSFKQDSCNMHADAIMHLVICILYFSDGRKCSFTVWYELTTFS
ncbi:hypothetical protein ACJX0J_007718 [Zea mays]